MPEKPSKDKDLGQKVSIKNKHHLFFIKVSYQFCTADTVDI